ncbi:MAG: FHA domain-containing protein [Planctomycetota bacterium]
MADVHIRILDGADRGKVLDGLETPITIGREEGNTIQLNDDRVSRFHVKIQEDHEKVVLTDLESTNGTKVNGEDISLRILKFGDMITVGRSVLLFGSRDEIAGRLAELRTDDVEGTGDLDPEASSLDFELNWSDDEELQSTLHVLEPPDLPDRMDAIQSAQLSEMVEYMHIRIRRLLNSATSSEDDDVVALDQRQWQNLLDLQARLASYLRTIGKPDEV